MALDPSIILQGTNPETALLNALQIKGQMQQQRQQAAMAPLQQQSAQLGVQGQQLQVQQAQYQMDQQRRMMQAAQAAFSPQQSTAQPTSPTPSASPSPTTVTPPASATSAPPIAGSDTGDIDPDEMAQLPPAQASPITGTPVGAATATSAPATGTSDINPDEMPDLASTPTPANAATAAPAVMTPATPKATAQPAVAAPQTPKPNVQPAAASSSAPTSDPWEQFFNNMQQAGVHPQTVMAMRKEHQTLLQGAANLTKDQQTILQNQMNVYADVAKTALNQPDDATREQYYQSTGKPALIASGIPANSLPASLPTGDQGQQFLQQHLLTATAQGSVLSNVKGQQDTLAQTLGSATDGVDYQNKLRNAKASGNFLPSVINNFPQTYTGPETISQARSMGQTPEEQENAPKQEAASQQALLAADAQKLANAALQGPDAYTATLNAMPHGRASQFPAAPPAGQYDPKAFSNQIAGMGLTSQERSVAATTAAQRSETVRHNEAMEKLRGVSNGIRQQIANRQVGATGTANLNAQADLHDRLMSQAEDDRNQAGQLDQQIATPTDATGKTMVALPGGGGKQVPWNDAAKQYASQQSQTLKSRAQNLENQAVAIRARNHFGEFGTGAAPTAPGATPPPASNTPPPPPSNTPKQFTIGGKQYKVGDPISIKGQTYTFQGLDANGKIQASQ